MTSLKVYVFIASYCLLSGIFVIIFEYNIAGYDPIINQDPFNNDRLNNNAEQICSTFQFDKGNSGNSPYNVSDNPGRLIWRVNCSLGRAPLRSVVIDDEENSWLVTMYVIFKIDKNGLEILNITLPERYWFSGTPLLDNESNLYISLRNYTTIHTTYSLLSYYPNGTLRWDLPMGGTLSSPRINDDTIFIMSNNGTLTSIYLNGSINWIYNFGFSGGNNNKAPAIDSEGNIYFIFNDTLLSLTQEGKFRWEKKIPSPYLTPVIDRNDIIFFTGRRNVSAFYNNGTLKWIFEINTGINTVITLDKNNNPIFQVSVLSGTIIYSLKSEDGSINWTFVYEESYPKIVTSNDNHYIVSSSEGTLKVYDQNRKLKWSFETGDSVNYPVITPKGDIYFSSDDDFYYKIGRKIPSPPVNLTGRFRDDHVILSWDPPVDDGDLGIDEYRIYRGYMEYLEVYLGSVNGSSTEFNDTTAINGQTYYYYVTAVNIINESYPGNRIGGYPSGLADPPYQIQVKNVDNGIEFKWKYPIEPRGTEILSYILYRSRDNITFERHVVIPSAFSSFIDEDIDQGTIYHYYMRTKNKNGEGDRSQIFTIVSIGRPSTPRNFQLVAGDEFVNLSWSPLDHTGGLPLKYFNIFRRSNNLPTMVVRPSPDRLSYNDTNVTNGKRYWYSIGASNDYGLSLLTDEIEALPLGLPDPPENFSCERLGTSIKLTWTLPLYDGGTDRTSFRIYRIEKGTDHTDIYNVDPLSRSWIDENLANGTTYVYFMKSVNIIGESIPTERIEMKIVGISGPPVLKNVTLENDFLVIHWDIPLNTYGSELILYRVYRYDNPHFADILVETSDLMYYDSDFLYGNEYRYFVTVDCQVYESIIESEKSNQLSIKPLTIPDPPSISYSNFGDRFVEFRLSPPSFKGGSDTIWYEVFKTNNDQTYPKIVIGSNITSYNDEEVNNGETYQYYIYSVNEIGYSKTNASFEIKPLGLPSKPIGFQMKLDGDEMILSWNPPVDDGGELSGYHIYKGSNTNFLTLFDTVVNEDYIDFAESDGIYYYQVIAFNDAGEGEGSEVLSIRVDSEKDERMNLTPFIIGSIVIFILIILFLVLILKGRRNLDEE